MERPELIFVTGCNAAGKSSLIRSHRSELPDYEVIMTDVYKGRSREVFKEALRQRKCIILETPFNDEGFKDLVDLANNAGYKSTLITLFLRSPGQSLERVANRRTLENGLHISAANVEHNFIENLRNVSKYYAYFEESYFVYTGEVHRNQLIMRFEKERLVEYKANDLAYVQKFTEMACHNQVLDRQELEIIAANKDFAMAERIGQGKKFKI
jgi:predicted ABC-type ATPase